MRTKLAWSAAFAACALFYSGMVLAQQAPADPRPPLLEEPTQAPPDPRPPSRALDQPASGQSEHKQSGSDTTAQGKSDAPPPRIESDQSQESKGGEGQAQ